MEHVPVEPPFNADLRVETLVQQHLSSEHAPVFYEQSGLIGSLFGLLGWEAIFQPLSGAFILSFQSAPADLGCADMWDDDGVFRGLPGQARHRRLAFVHSASSSRSTAPRRRSCTGKCSMTRCSNLHLDCIAPDHLKLCFQRPLGDVIENATGLPDLVQFFPERRTYELIEVKSQGDRLKNSQRRWLHCCAQHQLPMKVCRVTWT